MFLSSILKQKGSDVAHVAPAMSVAEVADLLAQRGIGAVLVCDTARQILGVVSERDIVRGLALHGGRVLQMTAAQLMTANPRTVPPGTSVPEAMAIMTEGRFRHLPVCEGGQLVGIVSIGDVVKARISQQDHEVDSLRAYVAGAA
jgi:CBS domain-containing protein